MTDTEAVAWVRRNGEIDKDELTDEDKRVILAVADLAGDGTGVAVDTERLAEHADVSVRVLAEALSRLHAVGLLATIESTMAGRLRIWLPILGKLTVIKNDDEE
jgi:hypothetical protein